MNRPLCKKCNKNLAQKAKNGRPGFRPNCSSCDRGYARSKNSTSNRPWIIYKKAQCERCAFVPEHSCQLDVDHIDGDKKNNDPSNLQTLCANCHRLKTYMGNENRPLGSRMPVQVLVSMSPPQVLTT